jgi:RNA polymerase sigma-70 factor (ECF subfamily)
MSAHPPAPDETALLIERAKTGDQTAWRELYRRFRPQMSVAIHGRIPTPLRSRFDTDDVVQSAFLSAFESLSSFDYQNEARFRIWLRRVVVNKLHDRVRAHMRLTRSADNEQSGVDPDCDLAGLQGESPTPSEIIGRAERQAAMLDALSELPAEDQELVWLRFFERRQWSEVVATLGGAESSLRARYAKLIERLLRRVS